MWGRSAFTLDATSVKALVTEMKWLPQCYLAVYSVWWHCGVNGGLHSIYWLHPHRGTIYNQVPNADTADLRGTPGSDAN